MIDEPEVISAKRKKALADLRAAGEAEGLSEQIIQEGEASMRRMFYEADTMNLINSVLFRGQP